MNESRKTYEAWPPGSRVANLLALAVIPAFLGIMAMANDATGWGIGLFAVAAVLALPGLIGFVLSDN